MVKKRISFSLIILLIFPVISAVEFDMKSEFSQGETLMAKISGNFLDQIKKENVFFYRGHTRIPMEFDVANIDGDFYIYAVLEGKQQNNYSISIEEVRYMKGSQILDENIVRNFSINNNTADFLVNPGFVVTDKDFFIEVQNLQDYEITIEITTQVVYGSDDDAGFFESLFGSSSSATGEKSIKLKSGEIEKINFDIENISSSTFSLINLGTDNLNYKIPVSITSNKSLEGEEVGERKIKFEPSEFDVEISTESDIRSIIYLHNIGEQTIEDIYLSVSGILEQYVFLSIDEIDELEKNDSVKIEVLVLSEEDERYLEGNIKAKTEKNGTLTAYSAVTLNFIKDFVPLDEPDYSPQEPELEPEDSGADNNKIASKECSKKFGKICDEDSECQGESEYVPEGVCCLGSCEQVKKSSTGKIIGWSIIILIISFLTWFFLSKYKGASTKKVDLFSIARGKR